MRCVALAVIGATALGACGGSASGGPDGGAIDGGPDGGAVDGGAADARAGMLTLPPENAGLDYQLGGAYPPPSGVQIVSRDRTASPAAGLYSICYVNGFQIQPGEAASWMKDHADLIL